MSLQQIAEAVGARLVGDGRIQVSAVASIESATPDDLVFVDNEKHLAAALQSHAGAVIAGEFASSASCDRTLLISGHPKLSFARAARFLQENSPLSSIHQKGSVHSTAVIHASAVLGPGVLVEERAVVAESAQIGENTRIAAGCVIGAGVNIGAGTITCNYDGVHKHTTVVEDGVFVGSDSTLVAPVKLRRGSYVAAASCITDDVAEDSLAIGRSRPLVTAGWAKQKRAGTAAKG